MHFLCESCIFFELRFFAVLPTLMFLEKYVEVAGMGKGGEMGLCPLLVTLRDSVSVEGSNISQSCFITYLFVWHWHGGQVMISPCVTPEGQLFLAASGAWRVL